MRNVGATNIDSSLSKSAAGELRGRKALLGGNAAAALLFVLFWLVIEPIAIGELDRCLIAQPSTPLSWFNSETSQWIFGGTLLVAASLALVASLAILLPVWRSIRMASWRDRIMRINLFFVWPLTFTLAFVTYMVLCSWLWD